MDDAPIFEQLAVVRETGLFNTWAPFCNKSKLLAYLGRYVVVQSILAGTVLFVLLFLITMCKLAASLQVACTFTLLLWLHTSQYLT